MVVILFGKIEISTICKVYPLQLLCAVWN